MWRQAIFLLACAGCLIGLWPRADSLYDLTGEESTLSQLRGVLQWGLTVARPTLDLAPETAVAHADVSPFGINTFLEQEPSIDVRDETLRQIRAMGFRYIRQQFQWQDIEIAAKGDFEDRRNVDAIGVVSAWDKYDNIVTLAEKHDIEVIARLDDPPAWSRAVGNGENELDAKGPPDNVDDYGDFVAAVVSRYRGRIHYYQLWNEPNIFPEWGNQPPDPEAFVELACTGYARAKAADPDAVILAAALAPTQAFTERDMNDIIFLQRAYDAGFGDCFDVFSAQGYGFWSGPADQRLRPTVINYPHHLLLRDVMVRNGDADKAIWISEVGWNVAPDSVIGTDPLFYGQVSEAQQARYAVGVYERARADWPWIGVINYWFFKRPSDAEANQQWYYFRAMEPDFTPLPVHGALSAYANGDLPDQGVKVDAAWRRPLFFVSLFMLTLTGAHLLQPSDDDAAA